MDDKESGVTEPANVPGFDQMHDLVVPDPVTWWPLAPGWWVVLLALGLALIWLASHSYRRWKQNAYRREALRELQTIPASELPALVKRVCLATYPREEVAALSGEPWLEFLDQTGNTTDFTQGPGRHLLELSYNPHFTPPDDLTKLIRQWIVGPIGNRSSAYR